MDDGELQAQVFQKLVSPVNLVETNTDGLVNAYRAHRNDDPNDLVHLAQQIQKAGEFIEGNTSNQLIHIMEQIQVLQDQARQVLEDAKRNATLHQHACNVVKKEWGPSCPHTHIGSYRLETDQSWTPLADLESRDQQKALITRFITRNAITDSPHSMSS